MFKHIEDIDMEKIYRITKGSYWLRCLINDAQKVFPTPRWFFFKNALLGIWLRFCYSEFIEDASKK